MHKHNSENESHKEKENKISEYYYATKITKKNNITDILNNYM